MRQRIHQLGNMNESEVNAKKVLAISEMIARPVRARNIRRKLNMPTKQVSSFLKRTDEVKREKEGKTYQYTVDIPEIPSKMKFGDEWIEIEEIEKDGKMCRKITTSQGEEKILKM